MTHWRALGRLRSGDPRHIAGFEVVGRLGEGGMGVVYLATHPELGAAALKLVQDGRSADDSFRARFRREVEAATAVRSPRVARVLAADADAERPWLATAFVDGPTLHEAVDAAGPMAGDRLLALAVALADALAAIHRARVVHRDLKPANILLTAKTPVVIDFGIASLREAPALTRTGLAIGTPGWMAPEQVRGRRSGPRTDVFAWGLVVAYAASGRPPFGRGPADAKLYRIVHEAPRLPDLPPPLGEVVRSALAKDPRQRPEVAEVLASLTAGALEATVEGNTALGPTLADRTEVVPTIIALGWGVDALPARPGGRPRSVPAGVVVIPPVPPAPPGDAAPAKPPPPPPPPAPDEAQPEPAAVAPAGGFWFAGEEHHDARSLAAALQGSWDDAVDQVFRRRDPIWLGELRTFLQARALAEADGMVAAGAGDAPGSAALARLLLALDPRLAPRVGTVWLTPDGLATAAQAVVDGRDPGDRLADIGAARVLRLWRGLPGLERAASIDERWHAGCEVFARLAARVSSQAGAPTPAQRRQASATLLLCAVHPEHERTLARRLAAARRTAARRQLWWAQLAAEGARVPAAAVVAVMTAARARSLAQGERQSARAADRRRREQERVEGRRRRAQAASLRARHVPLPRATTVARRGWVLATMVVALLTYLWVDRTFGDQLVAHYQVVDPAAPNAGERLQAYREASGATGLAAALLVVLPAMHVVTRSIFRRGAGRGAVRAYAGAAAVVDLVLGLTLVPAATLGALVLGVGVDTRVDGAASAFAPDEPWVAAGLLLPLGLVGLFLVVRSCWRLGRVVLARPVATRLPAPAPLPPLALGPPPPPVPVHRVSPPVAS